MNDVAIVILNYNSSEFTINALKSIKEKVSKDVSYQVIVIDNNSNELDYVNLKNNFPTCPNFKLHRSIVNTGFGGGNMLGTQFVNAKYILYLNNDTLFINDCLSILFKYMESNLNCGVVTAQNYNINNEQVPSFDHFRGLRKLFFGRSFLEKRNKVKFPERKIKYTKPVTVNFVNGAFMFFRTTAFVEVGGFDPSIFLYFEEMDICYRLLKKGYSTVLNPLAKIIHFQGVSVEVSCCEFASNEALLSYMYVLKKNYSWFKYFIIKNYLISTYIFRPNKWFLLKSLYNNSNPKNTLRLKQKIVLNKKM